MWGAEGVVLWSLDEAAVFDPTDLGAEVTPAAVHAALAAGAPLRAFLLALRLNQPDLLRHVILSTPPQQVGRWCQQHILNPSLAKSQVANEQSGSSTKRYTSTHYHHGVVSKLQEARSSG